MADKDKIKRCLELAPKMGLLEAVKECDLDGEESAEILDLVMEAATCDKEEPGASKTGLLSMVFELCERQRRMEVSFDKLLDYTISMEQRFDGLCSVIDALTDAVHPGSPHNTRMTRSEASPPRHLALASAEPKIVELANRRPPSRTPPETRKGA